MSIEIQDFGKDLAHTDKKTRDAAVKLLIQYITNLQTLTIDESLKLWKGLFYTFWMSDKPPVQQHLAQILSNIVALVPQQHAIIYLQGFWSSIVKEWHGLDRIRLNKYYQLMRKIHGAALKWLSSYHFDSIYITAYSNVLLETSLKPNDSRIPLALTFHTIEVYFEELSLVCGRNVPSKVLYKLMIPFAHLLSETTNSVIREKLGELFDLMLLGEGNEFEYGVDCRLLIGLLVEASINETMTQLNKKFIDSMVKRYLMLNRLVMEDVLSYNCGDDVVVVKAGVNEDSSTLLVDQDIRMIQEELIQVKELDGMEAKVDMKTIDRIANAKELIQPPKMREESMNEESIQNQVMISPVHTTSAIDKSLKKTSLKQKVPIVPTLIEDMNQMEIIEPLITKVLTKKEKGTKRLLLESKKESLVEDLTLSVTKKRKQDTFQQDKEKKEKKGKKEKIDIDSMDGTMMKDEVSSDDDAEYEENPEEQGWTDMGAVNEADINGGGPQSLSKSPKTVQFNHQIDVQPFLKKSNVLSITKGSVKDVNERSVLKSIGQTFNTLDDGFPVIHRKVEPVFHQIEKRKKFKKSKGSGFKVQSRK